MSTLESNGHSPVPTLLPRVAIERLLCVAQAAVDSDRMTVKECLARAVELLREPEPSRLTAAATAPKGGLAGWQKKRIAAYVDAHMGSRILANDLAATVDLSPSHFFRAFRESFGATPLVYVSRLRMRRAQQLMLNSAEPLAQIAAACGLCDQAHLTRMFRRVVGVTPHAWRREFRTAG